MFWISISTEKLLKQAVLQGIKFFRTVAFSTKSLPQKRYFFRTATFPEVVLSKTATFSEKQLASNFLGELNFLLLSQRASFAAYNISEEVLFHSFTSYLSVIKGVLHQLHENFLWICYCWKYSWFILFLRLYKVFVSSYFSEYFFRACNF